MTTTFNLPDALVNEVKVLAAREGRSLDETAASLRRRGLEASAFRRLSLRERTPFRGAKGDNLRSPELAACIKERCA